MDNYFANDNKKISWVQICFLASFLTLAFSALSVLAKDSAVLVTSSSTVGVALLIAGALNLIIVAIKKSTLKGAPWLMADGIVTTVLSVFLIVTTPLSPYLYPILFALWEISLGIFKIAESRQLRYEKFKSHEGFLLVGIAEIISGVSFLIRPVDRFIGYNIAVVITLVIQMGAYALRYYFYPGMSKE